MKKKHPGSTFFIDCNPSFASYTELSVVAADRLIIPCTADGSSARAIKNISQLVYGHNVPDKYKNAIFAKKAKDQSLPVPPIYMVLLNRSTQYNQRASKAFDAMFENIKNEVKSLFETERSARGQEGKHIFHDIPDTHSVAIVASHKGLPIRKIKVGKYQVYEQNPQVQGVALDRYKKAIEGATNLL